MDNPASSSIDPFDPGVIATKIGFLKTLFRSHDIASEHVLPCIVKEYDGTANTVSVEPLAQNVVPTLDGKKSVHRPTYEDIPVMYSCHGGFSISFPLYRGDTGILIAMDRNCTDAIKDNSTALTKDQDEDNPLNKGSSAPTDFSLSSFANGVFIPFSFASGSSESGEVKITRLKTDTDDEVSAKINGDGIFIKRGDSQAVSMTDSGIKVENGGDSITMSKDGIEYDGKIDDERDVVTASRYDKASHQLQARTFSLSVRGSFPVKVGRISGWKMIDGGQAEPIPEE